MSHEGKTTFASRTRDRSCATTSRRRALIAALSASLCILSASGTATAEVTLEDSVREGVFIVFDGSAQPLAIIGRAGPELGTGETGRLPPRYRGANQSSWVIASRELASGDVPSVTALAGRAVRVVNATSACEATLGTPIVIAVKDSMVMEWERELRGETAHLGPMMAARYVWAEGAHIVVAPIVGTCPRDGLIVTTRTDSQVSFFARARTSRPRNAELATRYAASASGREMRRDHSALPRDWGRPVVGVVRWSIGANELALVDAPIHESCATSHYTTIFDDRSTPPIEHAFAWGPGSLVAVLDLDGDGVLELVFRDEDAWHRKVMRLGVGASELAPVADIDLTQSMGC